jgi:uncharacterized protein (DUF1501 family)
VNDISRRTLLGLGLKSLAVLGAGGCLGRFGRLYAAAPATQDYKALVCIFMMGGNDGNNLIVPIKTDSQTYSDYFGVRGATLGLPQDKLLPISTANGKETYALHPNLGPLKELYDGGLRGKLAFVANVGTLLKPITKAEYQQGGTAPANLFSHSDQQQQWQLATGPGSSNAGWGGRAAKIVSTDKSAHAFPPGISTAGNSLFLAGEIPHVSFGKGGLGLEGSNGWPDTVAREGAFQEIITFKTGMSLIQKANQVTAQSLEAAKELQGALSSASALKTSFPDTSLAQQLKQVAQIVSVRENLGVGCQIFFVSFGDFDTHSSAVPRQQALLTDLAASMSAFYRATVELGIEKQVLTFTESEFGRTLQPSSGAGSDHAWGSHHIVMGGAVKTADIYGTFPLLALKGPDDVTGRGVWLPTTSLDQYCATLASWFGVPDDSLTSVFPNLTNFHPRKLAFL